MFNIKVLPGEKNVEGDENLTLLENLKKAEVEINSSCGGYGNCRDCLVKIVAGEDFINPLTSAEKELLGNVFHVTKERLSCQVRCTYNIEIEIPKAAPSSKKSPKKMLIRKKKEVDEKRAERAKALDERKVEDDSWHRHWENEAEGENNGAPTSNESRPKKKRKGGSDRPRGMKVDYLESEQEASEASSNFNFRPKKEARSHQSVARSTPEKKESVSTNKFSNKAVVNKKATTPTQRDDFRKTRKPK